MPYIVTSVLSMRLKTTVIPSINDRATIGIASPACQKSQEISVRVDRVVPLVRVHMNPNGNPEESLMSADSVCDQDLLYG